VRVAENSIGDEGVLSIMKSIDGNMYIQEIHIGTSLRYL